LKINLTRRWPLVLIMAALIVSASGCVGGARTISWTGLTIQDDQIYAADLQHIQILMEENGEPVWAYPADPENDSRGVFSATPTLTEDYLIAASHTPQSGFFGQAQNTVWAIDLETRRDVWRFNQAKGQYIGGGAASESLFVIGNSDGNVYAVDIETGAEQWRFETDHRVWATPLIDGEIVYVGSMDRHLYALRLSDGEELWRFPAAGEEARGAFAETPALQDGVLYAGAFDHHLYAIDAESGEEVWRFESQNWFWGSPAIDETTVYAVDVDGNVFALNIETGEEEWHQPLEATVRGGPALGADGSRLIVGSRDGTLYALDTSDGFVDWTAENEGQILASPVVDEGAIYQTLVNGPYRIRALQLEDGREAWAYPRVEEE